MAFFGEKFKFQSGVRSALRRSYAAVNSLFDHSDARQKVEKCVLGVVKYLLSVDGEVDDGKILQLRNLLADFYPGGAVELLAKLRKLPIIEPAKAVKVLSPLSDEDKKTVIGFLLQATLSDEAAAAKSDEVVELAKAIGMDDQVFAELDETVRAENKKHNQLLRSGAGILVALGVIIVFILMATWLSSVAFGLIGAYMLLPLEKFYERNLRAKKGFWYWFGLVFLIDWLFIGVDGLLWPLRQLSAWISGHGRKNKENKDEVEKEKKEKKVITQAVTMTAVIFLLIVFLFSKLIFSTIGTYAQQIKEKIIPPVETSSEQVVNGGEKKADATQSKETDTPSPALTQTHQPEEKSWWRKGVDKVKGWFSDDQKSSAPIVVADTVSEKSLGSGSASGSEEPNLLTPLVQYLDDLSDKFQKESWVKTLIEEFQKWLQKDDTANKLMTELVKNSDNMLDFSVAMVGTVTGWVVDFLLSIFFGLLFLTKLAEFCKDDDSRNRQSEYLVRTIFNGTWLPKTDENTLNDANRIISGTITRLRIWARGYITIVLIDMIVYSVAFSVIGVKYAAILGVVAGCGVLLPYVGPISTATLTVLVSMATGGGGAQILGIVIFYLIYSGVIEQFITYPAIIGESLGLTTLETIIVVLLGALFAGITGMILALPTASVIKFLIPQIYRWIGGNSETIGKKLQIH